VAYAELINYSVDRSDAGLMVTKSEFLIAHRKMSRWGVIMTAFERICVGAACTGFLVLVSATLMLFIVAK
jgi:hypothetical protein